MTSATWVDRRFLGAPWTANGYAFGSTYSGAERPLTSFDPYESLDILGAALAGGLTKQVLFKRSNDTYDFTWGSTVIPAGGLAGQALIKRTNTSYDVTWGDSVSPGGGGTDLDGGDASSPQPGSADCGDVAVVATDPYDGGPA